MFFYTECLVLGQLNFSSELRKLLVPDTIGHSGTKLESSFLRPFSEKCFSHNPTNFREIFSALSFPKLCCARHNHNGEHLRSDEPQDSLSLS